MAELMRLPEVATGTTEAVLSSWSVSESAKVAARDVIATVETAKAVVDVEAESDGVVLRLLVKPGEEVATGDPIALIGSPDESVPDVDALLRELGVTDGEAEAAAPAVPEEPVALEVPEAATTQRPSPVEDVEVPAPAEPENGAGKRIFASPLARRLAKEAGLRVEQITGTGPNGRIVRRDVEKARAAAPAAPPTTTTSTAPAAATAPAGTGGAGFTDVPHSRLRRLIAARLVESKTTAPHFYVRATVPVDRLLALREEVNASEGVRVSVNDLVVKAVAHAHQLVPEMNVIWLPEAVRRLASVDVAVAVATPEGLVTPVLHAVEGMTLTAVAGATRDLAERARSSRLQQHEIEGGSITVTNLGMYGTEEFAAIINPPQASILAVGAARPEPVVVDGRLEVATVMRLTLSVDHRPVDGVVAARWMGALVELLTHPVRILA